MNIRTTRLAIGIASVALIAAACSPIGKMSKALKKAKYTMSPPILEVRGDSVDVGFKMTVPPDAVNKKGVIKLEPILRYGTDELVLKPYIIKGEKAQEPNANITMKSTGGSITYTDRVLYNPIMKNCTLYIQPNLKIKSYDELLDKCLEIPKDSLGLGTITTALSYKVDENVSMPEAKCSGPKMDRKANIYYIVDTWDFKSKLVNKKAKTSNPDELKSLVSYLTDKSEYQLTSLSLLSTASPDGTFKRNALLSRNRDVTAYNFLKRELKRIGFSEVNDSIFSSRNKITEEMDGLKAALELSNIKDKQWFMDILNSGDQPDVKERKMREEFEKGEDHVYRMSEKKHWTSYRFILDFIMPRLRRSEITVTGEKGCKPYFEIAQEATKNMDNLNIDELLIYGGKVEDISLQEKTYKYISVKYPNDWRGFNNLGAIQIKQNKFSDAKLNLEKALTLNKDNGDVYNNLGVCFRNLKDYSKAEENYKMAKARGTKVDMNMGILNMIRGQYPDAITNFNAANKNCYYNTSLAYTMNGEYDKAQKSIECMDAKDKDAQSWYLKAIIAARAGNASDMATFLKKAITTDSKYKAMAMEDLEFLKYRKSNEFKSALN